MKEETNDKTNILDDKKFWLICPKCKNFPLITPIIDKESKEISIKVKCRCNKFNEEKYSLKEYFSQTTQKLKHKMSCTKNPAHKGYLAINYCFECQEFLCSLCCTIHKALNKEHIISDEAIKIDTICDRHLRGNEIISYCNDCNMNLCSTCLREHNIHHNIFELRSFFPKKLSNKYFEDFKLIQITFFKYINEAKKIFDEKIKEKNDEEGLDQNSKNDLKNATKNLNIAYTKNSQLNHELIKLISYMFENYNNTIETSPNFNIIYELKNLTKFNNNLKIYKFDDNISLLENINNFIDYLNRMFIIKTINSPLEVKEIVKIPKLNNTRVLLALNESKICSGNWESNIQIFDINTKNIIKTIAGHFSGINSLCLINGEYILSGGCDAAMNIFDPSDAIDNNKKDEDEGESCYRGFINGHDDAVSKIIQFKDGKVATCGFDKKINIFGKLLTNEAKEDFPVIPLTEEEKEKLEKQRQEKEKKEKIEKEKQEKLEKEKQEKLEKEKQEKEKQDKDNDKEKDKESKQNENNENNENENENNEKKENNENNENQENNENNENQENQENKEEEKKKEEGEKEQNEESKKKSFYISLEKLATFELPNKVFDICEFKDGSLIACCLDKTLRIYNMETLKEEKMIKIDFVPSKIASLGDGRIVVGFGDRDSFGIKIFKLDDKKELVFEKDFITHTKNISCLYILEDGKIATTSLDGTAAFYNPFDMKVVCKIEEIQKKNFTSITQLEDRSIILSSNKGNIYVLQ